MKDEEIFLKDVKQSKHLSFNGFTYEIKLH